LFHTHATSCGTRMQADRDNFKIKDNRIIGKNTN